MKVVYIPETPLGECFYDPISHEGITLIQSKAVHVTMNQSFNPQTEKNIREINIETEVFRELIAALSKRSLSTKEVREVFRTML